VPISFTVNHGITRSVYFRDPDGHELEVYCDNPAEEIAALPNSYMGMAKLDFAPDDPGLADVFAQMRNWAARSARNLRRSAVAGCTLTASSDKEGVCEIHAAYQPRGAGLSTGT
jgi:hypothetical protein